MSRTVLIHEGGHALTGMALFKNANPTIRYDYSIFCPVGGSTSFNRTLELSSWGEKIGFNNSRTLVKGMGTGAKCKKEEPAVEEVHEEDEQKGLRM